MSKFYSVVKVRTSMAKTPKTERACECQGVELDGGGQGWAQWECDI